MRFVVDCSEPQDIRMVGQPALDFPLTAAKRSSEWRHWRGADDTVCNRTRQHQLQVSKRAPFPVAGGHHDSQRRDDTQEPLKLTAVLHLLPVGNSWRLQDTVEVEEEYGAAGCSSASTEAFMR